MKEEDLRQEAYKECKKSQQRETMMYFAIIAVTGTLIGFALVPVHFWLGCGLGLFLIALACYFARAIHLEAASDGASCGCTRHLDGSRSGGTEGRKGFRRQTDDNGRL